MAKARLTVLLSSYLPGSFPFLPKPLARCFLFNHKFRLYRNNRSENFLFPIIAGDFIVLAAVSFLIIFFQQFQYSG